MGRESQETVTAALPAPPRRHPALSPAVHWRPRKPTLATPSWAACATTYDATDQPCSREVTGTCRAAPGATSTLVGPNPASRAARIALACCAAGTLEPSGVDWW